MHIVICACCHVLCYISVLPASSSFFYYYFLGLFPMQCKYAMQCTQDYITLHTSWKQERKEGRRSYSLSGYSGRRMERGTVRLFLPKGSRVTLIFWLLLAPSIYWLLIYCFYPYWSLDVCEYGLWTSLCLTSLYLSLKS